MKSNRWTSERATEGGVMPPPITHAASDGTAPEPPRSGSLPTPPVAHPDASSSGAIRRSGPPPVQRPPSSTVKPATPDPALPRIEIDDSEMQGGLSAGSIVRANVAPDDLTESASLTPDWQQQRLRKLFRVGVIGKVFRWLIVDQPSFLTSFLTHALILLLLAMLLIQQPETAKHLTLSFSEAGEETLELDSITIDPAGSQPNDSPLPVTELVDPQPITVPEVTVAPPVPTISEMASLPTNLASTNIGETTAAAPGGIAGRQGRRGMAVGLGATAESEAAVDRALAWIAAHQTPDGYWTFDLRDCNCNGDCENRGTATRARYAATALALLPFLGAGQTHERGYYRKTIEDGLLYLIEASEKNSNGSFHEPIGTMYSHGLASLALCEALSMSTTDPGKTNGRYRKQPRLRRAANKAIRFIEYAQHPQGGWRYEPGQRGDTSVVGWQIMALKSGEMAGLTVKPRTWERADQFLNQVQSGDYGERYGYLSNSPRPGTTSVGLLCRMYRGWDRSHLGIVAGAEYLDEEGPAVENVYYNYYATQVMHHYGGPLWENWHPLLRDHLVKTQSTRGHETGSWYFNDSLENGGVLSGGINNVGGRLYVTSLATMILEVYYRHMPIYSQQAVPDRDRLRRN